MKKLSLAIFIFSLSVISFAQTTNDGKKDGQPENQIKQSNNFYINSDGLVVYKKQGSAANESSTSKPSESVAPRNSTSNNNSTVSSYTYDSPTSSQPNTTRPTTIKKEVYNGSKERTANNNRGISKPSETDNYNTTNSQPKEQDINYNTTANTTVKKEAIAVNKASVKQNETSNENIKITNTPANKQANNINQEEAERKYRKYGSYEKKQPEYKTIAEAALAIDDIIADLKKNEKRNAKPNSMSSRLSQGANRMGLRKKPLTSSYASDNNYTKSNNTEITNTYDEDESSWGSEPTYYINGYEVERSEVDLLKKKDIINKEFKIRNTISGNPNGEVWYEVSNYSIKN